MKKYSKGFTLIELLVVIAIIGILASVVLASLNSARTKGQDARTRSQLSSARAQAMLYSGATNAFTLGVCPTAATVRPTAPAGSLFMDNSTATNDMYNLVRNITGAQCAYGGGATPENGGVWALSAPISTGAFCVDSTGVARDKTLAGVNYSTALAAINGTTFSCN